MTGRKISNLLLVVIATLSLCSCNNGTIFTGSAAMDDRIWTLTNIQSFRLNITDTVSSNNMYFTIRTGSSYPFRNIYLFITTVSPEGKSITDTVQYDLADEKGAWYGRGVGDIHELNLPYKSNIYFPVKGNYEVKVQHGMRVGDLKGVYDLSLTVKKIKK